MKKLLTRTFALLAFVATSNAATVFTTDFTEASLAAAGMSTSSQDGASWVLDDGNDLATTSQGVGTQARANLYTTSAYSNSYNLTLEVDFKTTGTTGFSIGLVDSAGAAFNFDPIDIGGAYGLMFILAGANGDGDGDFVFSDGSGFTNLADGTQAYTPNVETALRFSINSDGDWAYSLDGAPATTGTIAGGSFDLSKSYQPYVYGRRQSTYDGASSVYSMTLSTIPEPSTLASLLLGGLICLYARKRQR